MIRIAGSVSKSWLAAHAAVTFDRDYYFDPRHRQQVDNYCNQFVRRELPDLNVCYTESNLGRLEFSSDDQVLVGGIQPNLIVGMLLGADFVTPAKADADISACCLADVADRELPDPRSLVRHPLIRQFDLQIRKIQATADRQSHPIPPFFWDASGRAAVHGAVTSGLKFYGDAFFLSMASEPERCARVVRWIAEVSAVLVRHFGEMGALPIQGIHVGECAACMIDADDFTRFVVPTVSLLGQAFGPVRFHSCGRSDHLIAACSEIQGLAELDVGGETSLSVIRRHFGMDFPVGIAPLVDDMRASTAEPILGWFRRVAEQNGNGDLTIGFHLEREYNVDTIRALHNVIKQRG